MNAQDFLTQLISGLQDGSICYMIVSFVWFTACRLSAPAAGAAEAVAVDDLPSLAELFAMADALTAEAPTEAPQPQILATGSACR